MKITKHGQSCFLIETELGSRALIDPGVYVFGQKEKLTPDNFKGIDILIITHEHSDHFDIDNIATIIDREKTIEIFTTVAVGEIISAKLGIKTETISRGFSREGLGAFGDISLTGVLSQHGPLPNGNEPPIVSGVLLEEKNGPSFYDPGDTVELNTTADIIATPICGKVVLNIEEAKEQLLELKPKIAIPIHYDNPAFPVNVDDFVETMKDTGIDVRVLSDGEMIEV